MRRPTGILILILLSGTCAVSVVSVRSLAQERKAVQKSETKMDESVRRVRKACGNVRLGFQMSWKGFDELDFETGGASKDQTITLAGNRVNQVANALISLCTNALDQSKYQSHVASLTGLRFTPNEDAHDFNYRFSRDGTVLEIRFGAFGISADQDIVGELKKVL